MAIQCPNCGGRGRCHGTIHQGDTILRYRRCPMCDHRWRGYEEADPRPVRHHKPRSKPQPDLFSPRPDDDRDHD